VSGITRAAPILRLHHGNNQTKVTGKPDFLYAALDPTTCAAFIKESRVNFAKANQLHRKSGKQQIELAA
jgi:hypothetical protein